MKSKRPRSKFAAFTLLAKPSGAACNLACRYCFYLDKEHLYPSSNFRMSEAVLESYLQQLLACQPTGEVGISWQGGEPTLMSLDFFKHSIELVNRYKKPYQVVSYLLQTNGTLLNDEWCNFFRNHNFLIGLSLDGTAEMHDAYRVNRLGQGSFDKARRSWNLLQEHRVDTNILCAVHSANASHPIQVYRYFRDELHAQFIQFIPIVERLKPESHQQAEKDFQELPDARDDHAVKGSNLVSQRSVTPHQYGTFLIDIFEEWRHHDVGRVYIQSFDAALASWCGLPASVCIFQQVCGSSLILEHNGDLYSCDHFVDPAHRLGKILEQPMAELARSSQQQHFGLSKRSQLPAACRQCDWLFACHGECPRNRFVQTADGKEGSLNYLCPSYKAFFQHIDRPMRMMARLLRQGRAPAEIMELVK